MKAARTSGIQDTEFVRCPAVQDKREETFEGCVQDHAGVPTEQTGEATVEKARVLNKKQIHT